MPLYAISKRERMRYEIDDAVIYYRRLTLVERREIDTRNTVNGMRDSDEVVLDICRTCIVGWENYLDPIDGLPIPYNPNDVAAFNAAIAALPVQVQTDLGMLMQQPLAKRDAEIKNSKAGSSAATQLGIG